MSRDPVAEARRWLSQATHDLADAQLLTEHGRHASACFHCHQPTEKALKAIIYASGADVVLGHSVRDLCEEDARLVPDAASRCADWALLDQYYIPTRYPDALPGNVPAEAYSGSQAQGAVETARSAIDFSTGRLTT